MGLQGRVDALDGIQVPEVNDQDGNARRMQRKRQQRWRRPRRKWKRAEAADKAAKDKLCRAECRQADHAGREGAAGNGEAEWLTP
ncbi:hypothetical protein BU55_25390 [Escherichia coli O146:H21 str. 2010C-3325]|uniref:GA-like domain-containing protein n=1 Tax=Escherichia coli TaxID=562 RepID=UPI0004DB0DD3|nr:hypothetical protein [Escherichia coli]KDV35044.1 hypothetical protein BU55_25390 [Escherichia coli O146:H21 str. 2010C-3325]